MQPSQSTESIPEVAPRFEREYAVPSSNLEAVAYDVHTEVLQVRFQNGGVYRYFDVPPACYAQFLNAPSLGGFFAASIKSAYRYEKVS